VSRVNRACKKIRWVSVNRVCQKPGVSMSSVSYQCKTGVLENFQRDTTVDVPGSQENTQTKNDRLTCIGTAPPIMPLAAVFAGIIPMLAAGGMVPPPSNPFGMPPPGITCCWGMYMPPGTRQYTFLLLSSQGNTCQVVSCCNNCIDGGSFHLKRTT